MRDTTAPQTSAESDILAALKERQRQSGMGTNAFARWLDISPALWVQARDGQRPLGVRLAVAAAKNLPELEGRVLIFLRYELPTRNHKVDH